MRPSNSTLSALKIMPLAGPETRSSCGACNDTAMRSGSGGKPNSLKRARVQLTTKTGAPPGLASVTGPVISPLSSVGRNTSAEKVTPVARTSNGGWLLLNRAAASLQRLAMLNGKPPISWLPQA